MHETSVEAVCSPVLCPARVTGQGLLALPFAIKHSHTEQEFATFVAKPFDK